MNCGCLQPLKIFFYSQNAVSHHLLGGLKSSAVMFLQLCSVYGQVCLSAHQTFPILYSSGIRYELGVLIVAGITINLYWSPACRKFLSETFYLVSVEQWHKFWNVLSLGEHMGMLFEPSNRYSIPIWVQSSRFRSCCLSSACCPSFALIVILVHLSLLVVQWYVPFSLQIRLSYLGNLQEKITAQLHG